VNYSTDEAFGGSSGFQTGSTFKAFTLAEWLATGHTLNQYVSSNQHVFPFSEFTNSCEDIGRGIWDVANDTNFRGSYSVLDATAQSINTVFARMGTRLDLCKIANLAKAMGIHTANGTPLTEYPSMILGVNELSPLDLASAYAGFADNGVVCTPVAITKVTTASGTSITPTPTSCTRGVQPNVAATVDYALRFVLTGNGTAKSANPYDGIPKFAKTGTTDSDIQNWLVTSTTKYTNATWVGNVSGNIPLGHKALLGRANGYNAKFHIGKTLMKYLDARYGGNQLPKPDQAMVGNRRSYAPRNTHHPSSAQNSPKSAPSSPPAPTNTPPAAPAPAPTTPGASRSGPSVSPTP
jgi:membrane peptidoglycan carboxypeptidase